MTLGDVILKDINNVFSSGNMAKAYDDIASVYQRSIEKSNAASLNPDGSERISLSDSAPFFYRTNKADICRAPAGALQISFGPRGRLLYGSTRIW